LTASGSLSDREDAFGQYLFDFHESGQTGEAFLERDDGYERPLSRPTSSSSRQRLGDREALWERRLAFVLRRAAEVVN